LVCVGRGDFDGTDVATLEVAFEGSRTDWDDFSLKSLEFAYGFVGFV